MKVLDATFLIDYLNGVIYSHAAKESVVWLRSM